MCSILKKTNCNRLYCPSYYFFHIKRFKLSFVFLSTEESIFPKSQRLSSYVDKLLTWRPPCLFGTIPDSEPESDNDDALMDKLVNTPVLFPEGCLQ